MQIHLVKPHYKQLSEAESDTSSARIYKPLLRKSPAQELLSQSIYGHKKQEQWPLTARLMDKMGMA